VDFGSLEATVAERIQYYARIKRVVDYVKRNVGEKLTLEQVASIACMEKTAFSKCFKKRIGVSFSQYLRSYRVATAIAAMRGSDCSITEIAYRTGFSSSGAFARVFKQVTDSSPSSYRREMLRRDGFLVPPGKSAALAKDRSVSDTIREASSDPPEL